MQARIIANLGLMLIGLLLAFIMVEGALRIAGVNHARFRTRDAQLGEVLRPGFADHYTREGFSYVEINSQGFRDVERSLEPPPNTIRIAVLGDSFTAALEVERHQRFTELAEDALQTCPAAGGKAVQVMNFGMPAFGTAQELMLYRERIAAYRPDVVVLAFLTKNDIDNNVIREDETPANPVFILRNGQLVLDRTFQKSIDRPSTWDEVYTLAYDNLRLVQMLGSPALSAGLSLLISDPRHFLEGRTTEIGDEPSDPSDPLAYGGAMSRMVYKEPDRDFTQNAWRMTELLLLAFKQEVTANGAKFVLVTLSNDPQVYPDPAVRQKAMRKIGVTDLFYADTRIRQFAERNGMAVLTLAPAFQEYADEHHAFLHGFPPHLGAGHWNQEGHRLAAQMIAQKLCQDILPS